MSRWVVVDDNSSGISYEGVWTVVDGMMDGTPAGSGPPLYNTLHGAHSDASIAFDFKGSSFVVIGSQFSNSLPQWTCIIDDVVIVTPNVSVGNNLQLCSKTVADGTHRLVVNISATEDQPFWFDNMEYLPSAGMSLDQVDVVYGSDDSLVQCDSDWDSMKDGTMTMRNGSKMTFNFNGVSLTWFGVYNNSHPQGTAIATYSVDGETPISFTLDNLSTDDVPLLFDQQLFQTSKYSPGDHRLEVIYQGHPETTPLTLEHLIVQGTTLNPPVVSSLTTSTILVTATSASTQAPTTHKGNSKLVASVVGGAIGGFLFLVFLAIIYLFLRRCSRSRKWRKHHPEEAFREVIEPYTHNPLLLRPSNYDPLPTTTKRPIQLGNSGASRGSLTPSNPRRSMIRNLVDSLASATFGTSRRGTSEGSRTTLLPSSSSSSYHHARNSSSWIVVHEDSGVRLLPQAPDVIEIPPTYSAR